MNRTHTVGHDFDAETYALRSGLLSRADLVTITPPPIAAVRQRAQKRRIRRGVFQGLSGVVATSAVAAGVFAWSPGRDPVSEPVPGNTDKPTMSLSPTPSTPTTATTNTPPTPASASRAPGTTRRKYR